jgi:hypothetical protein
VAIYHRLEAHTLHPHMFPCHRSHSWISGGDHCRCFGSDRTPRVAHQGVFRSRTMLPTVARWFVLGARETVNNDVQVRAA